MKTGIIVDSTADLMPEFKNRVQVVPLTVCFGDREYLDGITIDHKTFYERLVECDVLPTTSQAAPYAFSEVFEPLVEEGHEVVAIVVSGALSGTCQSANIAAADHPGKVFVVDSRNIAIGSGILVELALRLLDAGMSSGP